MSAQDDRFCERHGPYDPPHTSCPYCAMENQRPGGAANFPPPNYDEAETNIGPEQGSFTPYDDEVPTALATTPGGHARQPHLDDMPTELPRRRRGFDDYDDDMTELDVAPTGPLGFLIVKEPAMRRGTVYQIQDKHTIGRKGTNIVLPDKKISRQHARIRLEKEEESDEELFVIYDFGGGNGTFVNDQKIRGAQELRENDEVKMGNMVFVFKMMMT